MYKEPKRILFATVPGDGHFNPLTGLAVHLQAAGHDVRWYTSTTFAGKLQTLNIPHYPLKKAFDISSGGPDDLFPERKKIKGQAQRLAFDLTNGFILRSTEYFEDIATIYETFPFDAMICDCAFTAIPFVKEKLKVPVVSIGVAPLIETSTDLPPMGMGMMPSTSFFGRRKQDLLRFVADKILFRKANRLMASLLRQHGIQTEGTNFFDCLVRKSTLFLQSGTPSFEYRRSDLGKNVRFIGPLLPYTSPTKRAAWTHEKLKQYRDVILITQGTVEKDVSKLIVPALEAFKDSGYLVVATTGGSQTAALQKKYAHPNVIIEDFIPFADVMPYASVYITNGGYGGVMLGVQHRLPLVVAGVHEGKAEINARVGYFKLGINLGTERPSPSQLKNSVETVLRDKTYRSCVQELARQFAKYNSAGVVEQHLHALLHRRVQTKRPVVQTVAVCENNES